MPRKLPYTEDSPLQPLYPYDTSKACADLIARSFFHSFGLPVAVTRFANIYGGGDLNFSRIVPGTIRSVLQGYNPVIRSDGTPERDFIHVDDVVDLYLEIGRRLPADGVSGGAFNGGHKRPVKVLDLVEKIITLSGKKGSAGHPGKGDGSRRDRPPVARCHEGQRSPRMGSLKSDLKRDCLGQSSGTARRLSRVLLNNFLLMMKAKRGRYKGIKEIFVKGTNWVGDTMMSFPAVHSLRCLFPQAHIVVLVKSSLADLWKAHPDIDEVIPYDFPKGVGRIFGELGIA